MLNRYNKKAIVIWDNSKELVFPFSTIGCIQFVKYVIHKTAGSWEITKLKEKIMDTYAVPSAATYMGVYQFYFNEAKRIINDFFPGCFTEEQFHKANGYITSKCLKFYGSLPNTIIHNQSCQIWVTKDVFIPINMVTIYGYTYEYYGFRDNTFKLLNFHFEKSCSKFIKHCKDCGAKYFDQNDVESRGLKIPQALIGIDNYCRDCATNNDYIICEDCGRLCDYNDSTKLYMRDYYICEQCWQAGGYSRCPTCDRIFYTGDGDYVYSGYRGEYYCCEDCAISDGLAWDEEREDWVPEDECSVLLAGYHSTKFAKLGLMPRNAKQWLGFGIEHEVYGPDPYDLREFWEDKIKNIYVVPQKYDSDLYNNELISEGALLYTKGTKITEQVF